MNLTKYLSVTALIALSCMQHVMAQESPKIVRADKHPTLVASLPNVAMAKAFLAKDQYRLEDLVKLDIGLLLTNNSDYYFPTEFRYRIIVSNSAGDSIRIKNLMNVDNVSQYKKVRSTLLTQSVYLLIGCENKIIENFNNSFERVADLNDARSLFEKNIFALPAHSCININQADTLNLSVEVYNDLVVVSNGRKTTKTLVGTVQSRAVAIRITN